MTIETATPSSAETIAALFDHLVEAVAQRVMAKLTGGDGIALDNVLDAWAMNSTGLEDKVGDQIQSFVDNQLDLDDMVLEKVQELEFNVRVSR